MSLLAALTEDDAQADWVKKEALLTRMLSIPKPEIRLYVT